MQIDMKNHMKIRHMLERKGITFSSIGRRMELSHTTIIAVSQGRSRSRRVEAEIANELGVQPADLWPDRYAKEVSMSKK